MKLSSRKVQRGAQIELQMTSMIDVVFLLLIFFMTTASFVKTERQISSAIQYNENSSSSPSDLEPAIVEVVATGGRSHYRMGSRDISTREELVDVLRKFPNKEDGAYVKVSDDVQYEWAAAAIQACRDANFRSVTYVPSSSD